MPIVQMPMVDKSVLAKAEEVEITEPMLFAGLTVLPYLPEGALGTLAEETLVSEVYRAMRRNAPDYPYRRGKGEMPE